MERYIDLVKAIRDDDWKRMLEEVPEGITLEKTLYKDPEDFQDPSPTPNHAKYLFSARKELKEKSFEIVIALLEELQHPQKNTVTVTSYNWSTTGNGFRWKF